MNAEKMTWCEEVKNYLNRNLYKFDAYDLRCITSVIHFGTITKDLEFKRIHAKKLRYDIYQVIHTLTYDNLVDIVNFVKAVYPEEKIELMETEKFF